jgi:hypothetical protein
MTQLHESPVEYPAARCPQTLLPLRTPTNLERLGVSRVCIATRQYVRGLHE